MNALGRYWQQVLAVWAEMSPTRRVLLGLAALLAVVVPVGVLIYAYKVEYRELYSNLAPDDAGAITARLTTLSVPYKLSAGGTSILVPADQVDQVRLTLANDGVSNRGGKGFEIFDEPSLITTPFVQNVNYLRAKQTEIARQVMMMDSVAAARVHIAAPEPSPFIRDQQPPTASVVLKMKPGARLSRGTAKAISALVGNAFTGLTPEHITLMDTSGRLLSDLHQGDSEGLGNSEMEYRQKLEQHLALKVEELLGKTLGAGRTHAVVAADINTKLVHEKREIFNGGDKIALKETTRNSSNTGGGGPRGVAGATPNLGGKGSIIAAGPGGGKSQDEEVQTEYAIPKTIQEFEDKIGTLEALHVAVTVDLPDGANGKPVMSLDDVRELIQKAIGFKMGRDDIKVAAVKLANLESLEIPNEEAARLQSYQSYVVMARDIAFGLSAVLGVVFGLGLLRRLRRPTPAAEGASSATAAGTAPGSATDLTDAPRAGADSVLEEVAAMARDNPAMLASVLSSMMGSTAVQPRVGAGSPAGAGV